MIGPHGARPSGRSGRVAGERGSATVYVLGALMLLLTLTAVATGFAGLAGAKHSAAAAADLAALAGASAAGDRCAVAAQTARRNGARLARCVQEGPDVLVTVSVTARAPFGFRPQVRARARAGPAR